MRRLATFVTLLLTLTLFAPNAIAQDATPASPFADLGLPELAVTVTGTGYEGIPETLEAGRYLVSLTVAEEVSEFGGGIAFVQPPDGIPVDEFMTVFAAPPDESGVGEAAGTPVEGAEGSESHEHASGIPSAVFEATYAGGVYSFGGAPSQVVLDLTPGQWIGWADNPEAPQEPVVFEVTGEMPDDLPEPEAAATITMGEYVIEVTEGSLASGSQTIRVDNVGAQPHFVGWFQGPDGMTEDQIQVVLDEEEAAMMTGTPPAWSGLNPDEDLLPIVFTATQSTGTSLWITVDIEAGTHGLTCFFPDITDGRPHANHGMYNVVEVPA